ERRGRLRAVRDAGGDLDDVLGHARGGGVDHAAVELCGAAAGARRLVEREEDAAGAIHLCGRGREDLVGEWNLGRVNGPFALVAECGGPPGGGVVCIRVFEVAVGAIDGSTDDLVAGRYL